LSTLAIFLLLISGKMEVWHVFVATFFMAAFSTVQWPAYSAATTMLVPKDQLGRAGGMVQIGQAISQLISPAVAGALFVSYGLQAIVFVDFATFLFAVGTLLVIVIPEPVRTSKPEDGKTSLWVEMKYGWTFITERKGLLYLLLYFASINFTFGLFGPLITPMMLELGTPDQAGYVSSAIGAGMLIGTLVMSIWGGPKRRVYGILISGIWLGLCGMFLGAQPSLVLIAVVGFLLMIVIPIQNGSSQALWQTKTPPDVQGRVFSVRRMIAQFTSPIATIIVGPLVDYVMQPAMEPGGALASTVGQVIGVGPGRGQALVFVMVGLLTIIFSVAALANPRLRLVEDELPDVEVIEQEEKEVIAEEASPATA
jgi:MFS family permease